MFCNFCQDTGAVDKDGNVKGEHKSKLVPCPSCRKDGTATQLDVNVEQVLCSMTHKQKHWCLELRPDLFESQTEYATKELVQILIKEYGAFDPKTRARLGGKKVCAYLGTSEDGWYRIGFHRTFPYTQIKDLVKMLDHTIKEGDFRISLRELKSTSKKDIDTQK